jgi:hypothetical protein
MINLYCYSYPAAIKEFKKSGYILAKVGDSHRSTDVRISEQGGAAEWQGKIKIGEWTNCKKIQRDFEIHNILRVRGLWHKKDNAGTEWFKIPAKTTTEAFEYLDNVIADLEGDRVRKPVILRDQQSKTLDQAMSIIEQSAKSGSDSSNIIANLCPRFGKTIWALMLFNRISERYGNRVMLLPAYWLSAHTSFINELTEYSNFLDIREINADDPESYYDVGQYLSSGKRVVIPISLHGDLEEWKAKHHWISTIPNEEIFNFADEGDFGTHTENQVAKLKFLFNVN